MINRDIVTVASSMFIPLKLWREREFNKAVLALRKHNQEKILSSGLRKAAEQVDVMWQLSGYRPEYGTWIDVDEHEQGAMVVLTWAAKVPRT